MAKSDLKQQAADKVAAAKNQVAKAACEYAGIDRQSGD